MTSLPAEGPAPHSAGPRPQCALDCYAFSAAACTHVGGCPRLMLPALRLEKIIMPPANLPPLEYEPVREAISAREAAERDMAAFAARVKRNADEFAAKLSTMLPDGYSFRTGQGDE